jgi:hypothetical protein
LRRNVRRLALVLPAAVPTFGWQVGILRAWSPDAMAAADPKQLGKDPHRRCVWSLLCCPLEPIPEPLTPGPSPRDRFAVPGARGEHSGMGSESRCKLYFAPLVGAFCTL